MSDSDTKFLVRLASPLAKLRITQPYGVNWAGVGYYNGYPAKTHGGVDFRAPIGMPCSAAVGGRVRIDEGESYGKRLRIRCRELGVQVVYGHLSEFRVEDGSEVFRGQPDICRTGNTGKGTAPHLHFECWPYHFRPDGSGPHADFPDNGHYGKVDPMPMLDPERIPADVGYGVRPVPLSEMAGAIPHFILSAGRLPTFLEWKALRYGRWDLRTILDPAMLVTWMEMTKPGYLDSLRNL